VIAWAQDASDGQITGMDLDKADKKRLAKFILQQKAEYGSYAAINAALSAACQIASIKGKPVTAETMRGWATEKYDAIQKDSVYQLAALRGETYDQTVAWLEGVRYVPKAVEVEGGVVDATTTAGRELLLDMLVKNCPPAELLDYAQELLEQLGSKTGLIPDDESEAPRTEPVITLSPNDSNAGDWAELKRRLVITIATNGFDPMSGDGIGAFAKLVDVDPKLLQPILDRVEFSITGIELRAIASAITGDGPDCLDLIKRLICPAAVGCGKQG
jgi:hypothetical protein